MVKKYNTAIVWFRNDLRLYDNYALSKAVSLASEVINVYIFDKRNQTGHSKSREGNYPRAGAKRLQFVLESVKDLQKSLQKHKSNLIIKVGNSEEEIENLAKKCNAEIVIAHKEVAYEEIQMEKKLRAMLSKLDIQSEFIWDNTMFHIDDLPFSNISEIPDVFTSFRKKIESKKTPVRSCLPIPDIPELKYHLEKEDTFCSLNQLGISDEDIENLKKQDQSHSKDQKLLSFDGGETAGNARINEYIFENDCLKEYKETRNGLLGKNYSSKFSAWLAYGCVSPRYVYESVKKYESERVSNQSTYWLIFEMMFRDYFRYWVYKQGKRVFFAGGTKNRKDIKWIYNDEYLDAWCNGFTGFPFIDACMRELKSTGFMSNRGRQNVCSFLAKDMNLDWRLGAEWFENQLIDYDVASNWGNWVYCAGVGNDPREDRYFNILKQASLYDPDGEFVKFWCPELSQIPKELVHSPWKMYSFEQKKYNCQIGKDYPRPVIKLKAGMQPWKPKPGGGKRNKPFK